jgi:hypothetical protein
MLLYHFPYIKIFFFSVFKHLIYYMFDHHRYILIIKISYLAFYICFPCFNLNKWFSYKLEYFCFILWFCRFNVMLYDFPSLCGVRVISRFDTVFVCFSVLLWCLFGSDWQITFDQLLIQPMTRSSTM